MKNKIDVFAYFGQSFYKPGKRLTFSELSVGNIVLLNYSTENIDDFRVCKIINYFENKDGKTFEFDDGFYSQKNYNPDFDYPFLTEKEINSNDEKKWVYKLF